MNLRLPWRALLVAACLCRPALAWPPDLHRFVVEAALEISPAAAARIPGRYVNDVVNAAEGDRLSETLRAPFQEAQSTLDFLLATQKEPWTRNRAMAVGRLLNLVSHASVARDQYGPARTETLFAIREVVVFRVRRDLSGKLKDSLSSYLSASAWAEDPSTEMAEKFRDAANLVADTLLRLPGPPESDVAPGPVLFIYDPANSGVAGIPIFRGPLTTVNYSSPGAVARALARPTPTAPPRPEGKAGGKTGGKAEEKPEPTPVPRRYDGIVKRRSKFWRAFELPGINPMECKFRQTETDYVVRILFFNNSDECFTEFVTKGTKWSQTLPFVLPAFSLRTIEFKIPKSVLDEDVEFYSSTAVEKCPGDVQGAYVIKSYKPVASNAARGPNFSESPVLTQLPAIEELLRPPAAR